MKKYIFLCFTLFVSLLLSSCSQGAYSRTVSCRKIAEETILAASLDSYVELSREDASYYFSLDGCEDHFIAQSSSSSDVGEFGVFLGANEAQAKALESQCVSYVKELQKEQRAFIQSYAPMEVEKLDNAVVRRFGDYVIYAVLDRNSAQILMVRAEEMLKK